MPYSTFDIAIMIDNVTSEVPRRAFAFYDWALRDNSFSLIIFGALLSSIYYDMLIFPSSPFNKLNTLFYYMRILTLLQMILLIVGYFVDQIFFPVVHINVFLGAEWSLLLTFGLILRYYISKEVLLHPLCLLFPEEVDNTKEDKGTEKLSTKDRLLLEKLPDLGRHLMSNLLISSLILFVIYAASGRNDWFYLLSSIANYCHGRFCHVMLLRINQECILFERSSLEQKAKMFEHNRTAFVQFVLHEVRVPLSSIMLGLDLINSPELVGTEALETIEMMRQAANFMKATLNDVLSWQKIEQEGMVLNVTSFPPHFLLQTVGNNFRYNLLEKDINLTMHIDQGVPEWIEGDFFRLEHVLANLLSNAIKFSGEKTRIEMRCNLIPEHHVYFAVLDEGIGITEADRAKLFQPYVQINPEKLQGGKGSGLGLSICKKIVDAHCGNIACASRDDSRGSKFYFTIPLKEGKPNYEKFPMMESGATIDAQAAVSGSTSNLFATLSPTKFKPNIANAAPPKVTVCQDKATQVETELIDFSNLNTTESVQDRFQVKLISCESFDSDHTSLCSNSFLTTDASNVNPFGVTSSRTSMSSFPGDTDGKPSSHPLFAPINVLICDDVRANRKILEKVIGPKTLCTDCCEDGQEAVTRLTEKDENFYDVIFMDNMMPNMNGMEASKILRERKFTGLIVGVTGSAMETEVADFLHSGADLVLSKPLRLDTLNSLLQYCNEYDSKSPTYSSLHPNETEERLKRLNEIKCKQ